MSSRRSRCPLPCAIAAFLGVVMATSTAAAQLWKHFVPVSRSEAPQSADFTISETAGPWHVMAATFSGNGAEEQATELAQEFRRRYRQSAYVHEMTFSFADEQPGRGIDQYGAPVRRRYQRGDRVREFAVLVGDFPSIDDPDAQQVLERVKTMQPEALDTDDGEPTAQSLAQFREFQAAVMERLGKERAHGPMANAFLTRNPVLPREYFVPRGVDDFVARMNQGVDHSLLDCPGRYTVQVATFRGRSMLQTKDKNEQTAVSMWSRRKTRNGLVEAAENANLLAAKLRAHGWEAYEFHDRAESIVTIGSFDQVAQRLADGRVVPTAEVQKIISTFGAAYDTPADPLAGKQQDIAAQRRVEEFKQQVGHMLTNQNGQMATGMNPKFVKILKGNKVDRVIPIDVHPTAIEVPRRSVSSAYVGR